MKSPESKSRPPRTARVRFVMPRLLRITALPTARAFASASQPPARPCLRLTRHAVRRASSPVLPAPPGEDPDWSRLASRAQQPPADHRYGAEDCDQEDEMLDTARDPAKAFDI